MAARSFRFEQLVKASPTQVYNAFTNATALREWICDVSTVDPHPGGRLYMAWNSGFYACGEYTNLETDKRIGFTWFGRNEPAVSQVDISLNPKNGNTQVILVHSLPTSGEEWTAMAKELQKGWIESLENLASVLETGEDQRITRRPMLGITLSDFTPDLAKKMGVPVSEGYRLGGVIDGMGAQAAGLQSNDVIVEINGHKVRGGGDIPNVLEGKRAGDTLLVGFYRGSQLKTVEMKLSGRRIPEIPTSLEGLIRAARQIYTEQDKEIDPVIKDVTEEEASYKPKSEEWSVKEVLAHLIHSERFLQEFIVDLLGRQERWTDHFAGNLAPPILATITTFPTFPDLLRELRNSRAETVALYSNLPPEFMSLKGSFWRLAYYTMEISYHFQSHLAQVRAAIKASRTK